MIIGLLAAIALPKYGFTKDRAYVTSMKSDLGNLATAQETYWNDNATYYAGPIPGGAPYTPSPSVTVTVTAASASGWAATATHVNSGATCAVFFGPVSPPTPATTEGQITCQ